MQEYNELQEIAVTKEESPITKRVSSIQGELMRQVDALKCLEMGLSIVSVRKPEKEQEEKDGLISERLSDLEEMLKDIERVIIDNNKKILNLRNELRV